MKLRQYDGNEFDFHIQGTTFNCLSNGCGQGCGAGAGAGAAGAHTFWSELEPEPEPPKRFAWSRSRKKQGGSGPEKGHNCGKITEC